MKRILLAVFAALVVTVPQARADVILTDLNSEVRIDPLSQSGAFTWVVDGNDHLFQQWFWFRIGSTGGEGSLNLTEPAVDQANVQQVKLTYAFASFTAEIFYTLVGGAPGSNESDLAETIRIRNTTDSVLDFHFFQYSDFDLNGTAGGDTVQLLNANAVRQVGELLEINETVVTPPANGVELGSYPGTLTSLNDPDPTNFASNIGPYPWGMVGPGDVTWAFQWDDTIAAQGSFIISKDKRLSAPEPASLLLLGSGLALIGLSRRRTRSQ